MRYLLAAAALAATVLSATPPASAALAAGSHYAGVITTTVDTGSAHVGQPVRLVHVNGSGVSNATMYGSVTKVVRAGQGRPAELQMTFTRLVLPSGTSYATDGVVTGMHANTKNNALKEAGGALAGMIVGNMIGKTVFHASGGGLIGAAGGFLIAKNNRQNMTVPAGTGVSVTLRSVRRQSGHHYY